LPSGVGTVVAGATVLVLWTGARVVAAVVGAAVVGARVVGVAAPVEEVVGEAALADTETVVPRSTVMEPLGSEGSSCNMTDPERYLITSRARAISPGR
jgi:hypothetical protein